MPSAVFIRAVNVGGGNLCRPALLAKELAKFDVVNIGAVGTFVVRKEVPEATLRSAIAKKLPFKSEIMIVGANDLLKLTAKDPFARHAASDVITRFASIATKPVKSPPSLPLVFSYEDEWLLKVIQVQKQFVLGIYRRHMRAIGCLAKMEKQLGVPLTNRNWNTIERVVKILREG